MRRRLFSLAAGVSLLLCMATMMLWVYTARREVVQVVLARGHAFIVYSSGGCIFYRTGTQPPGSGQFFVSSIAPQMFIPYVVLCPTAFALGVLFFRLGRRRRNPGCCHHCGYSLTGNTSGTCPECGSPCPLSHDDTRTEKPPACVRSKS